MLVTVRLMGVTFFALAAYLAVEGFLDLAGHARLAVAAAALVTMPLELAPVGVGTPQLIERVTARQGAVDGLVSLAHEVKHAVGCLIADGGGLGWQVRGLSHAMLPFGVAGPGIRGPVTVSACRLVLIPTLRRELPFCPLAGIRGALRIPDAAGARQRNRRVLTSPGRLVESNG